METKICDKCGVEFGKPISYRVSVTTWKNKRFCSITCQRDSIKGWNKGKKQSEYMSKAGLDAIRQACISRIKNETPDQRKIRIENVHKTLKERGSYAKHRLGKTGEKDIGWKGEDANYNSKHKWIQKHWVKSGKCEECGATPIPNPLKRLKNATYWHNPTKTYRRERNEWMEVCAKCHYKLDKLSK